MPGWSYQAARYTGRQIMVALGKMARCSRSTSMERVLPRSIISQRCRPMLLMHTRWTLTATEPIHMAVLILCGDTLYGTTLAGGILANGTVFKVTTNGTGFTTLHSFGPTPPYPGAYTNEGGAFLKGGLVFGEQHAVWHDVLRRHGGEGHRVQGQHRRHRFYQSAHFHRPGYRRGIPGCQSPCVV